MPVKIVVQKDKEMTVNTKIEFFKEIHGSYGSKDVLIKKLVAIAPKMSKN